MEDQNSPATKPGIAVVQQGIATFENGLDEKIEQLRSEFQHGFANRARIETLERRVTELEQRLNLSPAA